MPTYDFNSPIDRTDVGSMKWDKYAGRDVLPMWVADMDFRGPPEIAAAIEKHVREHGVLGYTRDAWPDAAVSAYLKRQYDWTVLPAQIVTVPGLVCGLNVLTRMFPGAGVLTATPAYPPFMSSATNQGCASQQAKMLIDANGHWTLDFDALERALVKSGAAQTKIFMLCHPHNPTGRVWTKDELNAIATFCERHDLIVCSDEIHCDLILDERAQTHVPFAVACPTMASRTITLMAPSKTYNVAGLGAAIAVISDDQLRQRYEQAKAGIVPHVNVLGHVAMMAAWSGACEAWRQDCLAHLRSNANQLVNAIHAIPGLKARVPQATYLLWVDCRERFPTNAGKAFEEIGLGPNDGGDFGWPGFARFNLGCTQATMDEAIRRLQALR
jgi:cysteine-S-conjugate beta-lyase